MGMSRSLEYFVVEGREEENDYLALSSLWTGELSEKSSPSALTSLSESETEKS